jgi:glycogen operon protein
VPLLLAGDEFGRTQRGNNNAYCQDNETSWVDWSLVNGGDDLTKLVASLCRLRLSTPALHRSRFFAEAEILWLRPDGEQMTAEDWNESTAHAVALTAPGGRFTLLINAWWEPLSFRLPTEIRGESLSAVVETARDEDEPRDLSQVDDVVVAGRSLMLLERSAGQP